MERITITSDTRADIVAEILAMTVEMEGHVMDQNDGADDHTPNVVGHMRRLELLEKRIRAFDKYGVNSMEELKADPVFTRDNLLFRAVHGMQRSAQRWATRRTCGMTDAHLMDAYDMEAGDGYHGYSGDEGWFDCRPGKFTWKGKDFEDHVLTGSSLTRVLRDILHMPLPAGQENVAVEQLSIFSEP